MQKLQKPFQRARGDSESIFLVCYLIPKTQEVTAVSIQQFFIEIQWIWYTKSIDSLPESVHGFH